MPMSQSFCGDFFTDGAESLILVIERATGAITFVVRLTSLVIHNYVIVSLTVCVCLSLSVRLFCLWTHISRLNQMNE